jgi:hypothetical protein
MRLDPDRRAALRQAVRFLLSTRQLGSGHQQQLAEQFSVSRQYVHSVVKTERARLEDASEPPSRGVLSRVRIAEYAGQCQCLVCQNVAHRAAQVNPASVSTPSVVAVPVVGTVPLALAAAEAAV